MIQYSVVVPVYSGQNSIEELFNQLSTFFNANTYSYQLIFIYDCGPDDSWSVLKKIKSANPDLIKLIKLSRNFGQHNALICGFEHAEGEFIITMDEDLQHSPSDIQKLINTQKIGDYDLVYGKYDEKKHTIYRNFTSSLLKKLIAKGIPEVHPDYSSFRLIKSRIAKAATEMRNSYTFIDGYFSWITMNVGSCEVSHSERSSGKSSYTLGKLIEHSINIFVTFSNLPIRILTISSVLIFLVTISYSIYVVLRKILLNDMATGFATLIITIGMGVGFILLGLGIVGEYIYRVNLKTTKRPNYIVDSID